jgi:hypothetical protein
MALRILLSVEDCWWQVTGKWGQSSLEGKQEVWNVDRPRDAHERIWKKKHFGCRGLSTGAIVGIVIAVVVVVALVVCGAVFFVLRKKGSDAGTWTPIVHRHRSGKSYKCGNMNFWTSAGIFTKSSGQQAWIISPRPNSCPWPNNVNEKKKAFSEHGHVRNTKGANQMSRDIRASVQRESGRLSLPLARTRVMHSDPTSILAVHGKLKPARSN